MAQHVYVKSYSPIDLSDQVFDNIASLAKSCISSGKFPYTKDIPLAPNRDIITNHKLNSIQSIEMELHNSLIGNSDQNWIFGANAYLLGLELKISNRTEYNNEIKNNPNYNCQPIIAYARTLQKTKTNQIAGSKETNLLKEGLCIDCQTVYSLNQFTDESLKKCFRLSNIKEKLSLRGDYNLSEETKTAVAQALVENYSSNRCNSDNEIHRKNILSNVRENFSPENTTVREVINTNLKECRRDLNPTEKKCFDTLWNYFLKQNGYTGGITLQNKATDEDFLKVINESGSKKFAKMMFDASIFAERLTHYGFSYENVFTQLEFNKSMENIKKGITPEFSLPEAGKKENHIGENFISKMTKHKLHGNDYQYIKEKEPEMAFRTR